MMLMVSVDTMTAPAFRRRGLLTEVAARAYEAWRDAGIAFVIGLPNQQWGSRARALAGASCFPCSGLRDRYGPKRSSPDGSDCLVLAGSTCSERLESFRESPPASAHRYRRDGG